MRMAVCRFSIGVLLLLAILTTSAGAEQQVIVFTCHQSFNSRIYVMDTEGQVLDWEQYDNYRFNDLEVVDGEVHVSEAFAPRTYIVDLQTWELDLVIDDWSLFYFYDLAWDGQYLYVTEWDMNRYLPDGTKDSSADFDYDVLGSCWDGQSLWTLNEDGLMRSWDLGDWPDIQLASPTVLSPPGDSCRGLWYDGECFWSAEALDGQTGMIYRFDAGGAVVEEWEAPAFTGWGACLYDGYPSPISRSTWGAIKASGETAL